MKLAAVSSNSIIGNVQQNLNITIDWIQKLSKAGAGFILFPELNLSGYTKKIDVLNEVLDKKEFVFQELLNISEQIESAFAVGFPEKDETKYFISHFLFYKGKLVGSHRKTHLGPTEKVVFSEGDKINIFKVGDLKIGMQLCFETHFPEISYIQAKQGANVLAYAFASPKENAQTKLKRFKRFLPARAYDNACFVVACNQNAKISSDKESQVAAITIPGLGLIIDPKGNILCEAITEEEEFVLAEYNLQQINAIKNSKMGWFNNHKRENVLQEYYR